MNDLFIQGLTIDWNRVRPYNYVRQIPAISGIDTFTFHKPITFFVGENGSGWNEELFIFHIQLPFGTM